MKRTLLFIAMFLIANLSVMAQGISTWDGTTATSYGSGTGTEADPYLINTAQELALLAQNANLPTDYSGVYFRLTSNLDLNNLAWTPIAKNSYIDSFKGHFDGGNKTIANLNVNTSGEYNGLFGTVNTNATIANLGIVSGTVVANSAEGISIYAGAIAGLSHGTIQNCYNKSTVSATSTNTNSSIWILAGGIAGESYGNVKNCFNNANIMAAAYESNYSAVSCSGGLVGRSYGSTSNCYNRGDVSSAPMYAGGIIGMNAGTAITNSYNTGNLTSTWSQTGAITANGSSSNCYYLQGVSSNANGAVEMSETEMKSITFITTLNNGQLPALWIADYTPNINDQYPLLYYQTPANDNEPVGVVITIAEAENGILKLFKDGVEVFSGDKVEPGSKLKLVGIADDNYVLNALTVDGVNIIGYDYEVFAAAELSAKFEYSENVKRWDGTIAENYGGGTGIKDDPYLIYTPQEFALIGKKTAEGEYDMNTYFKLMNNLDLSLIEWTPIGADNNSPFRANIDGNHKTIANLYIKNNSIKHVGLFGFLNPIEIKNLGIIGHSSIVSTSRYSYVGTFAGVSNGSIVNCYNTANLIVSEDSYAAGFVGRNYGLITNCYNLGNIKISERSYGGGIAAENTKTISNCYNIGNIMTDDNSTLGAISTYTTGVITNCYYLSGSCTNDGGGIGKTESEMKAANLVTLLNNNQYNLPWIADQTPNINDGYPVLKWEVGAIFAINIIQPENGSIEVFHNGDKLNNGDKVTWESALMVSATPNNDYVVRAFIFDGGRIYGERNTVYDNSSVTAEFEYIANILRWDGTVATSYGGGNGSESSPYLINTPQELAYLAQQVNSGKRYDDQFFKLTNNFDLCHLEWTPIGISGVLAMTGKVDGNGKLVANIRSTAVNAGLFGVVVSEYVKDLGIIGINIISNIKSTEQSDPSYAGVIIARNHTKILNCFARGGKINAIQTGGGLVGINHGEVNNCYSDNGITSDLYAGGIAGANYGSISNSYSVGEVESWFMSQNYRGGITAFNDQKAEVINSYYILGKWINVGGGVEKTVAEMKTAEFVNELNLSQSKPAWSTDMTPNINDGFPIVKWQDTRKFTITVVQTANGSISPETTIVTFGDSQTFTIISSPNHHIVDILVDNASVGVVNEYTFNNIVSDHIITAIFAIDTYEITVNQVENGIISPSTITVEHGSNHTFTITPNADYYTTEVIVDGVNVGVVPSYTFVNIGAPHSLTAKFSKMIPKFNVVLPSVIGAIVKPVDGYTSPVSLGGEFKFTVTLESNYDNSTPMVKANNEELIANGNVYTISNINIDKIVTVENVKINTYKITVIQPENGNITPSTIDIAHGENQIFTIIPNVDYEVKDVIIDGKSCGAILSYTFTNVTETHTITALVEPKTGVNGIEDYDINIYAYDQYINVKTDSSIIGNIDIIDLSGRVVKSELLNSPLIRINIYTQGVYIVRIVSLDKTIIKTQKVIVK